MERHGQVPTVTSCETEKEELKKIQCLIEDFRKSEFASLGIICKSQGHAVTLFGQLREIYEDAVLLDFDSSLYGDGIVVTSVHMSKGLEFDQVIVPGASAGFYKTQLDRSLLYIACTRAMHKLDLTCQGMETGFLK